MSDAEEKRDKDEVGAGPTRSFNGSVKGTGEEIGAFRIERELGRGAAGVVYLAHDTKLDRQVAIKSLPAEVMENPKARSRFRREAKVLASLNHPNIATIYEELEEVEGVSYLILEYVAGQTLAERIARGPIKLEETLTIALQIAEAVAAAHEHDVIHRDLKPGNIKITPGGKVKVLDFGLAKVVGGEVIDQQSTITEPGRVIGTPAYMSPEQARGRETDKRSDIWSFGCVLYEMLTGRVPFKGETISDTLANILDREPDLGALPASTPANIRSLLRHCLKKEPRQRLRDMGDASIEISETLSLLTVTVPTVGKTRPVGLWLFITVIACLLVGAVVASLVTWKLKRPSAPPSKPVRHFVIRPEMVLGYEALWHHALALSPDGRQLVYIGEDSAGRRMLYLRELDEPKVRLLAGTESAISPFFSPDGQWIGFVDHFQKKLKKVSVKGGNPIVLGPPPDFHGGSWGADDTIIASPGYYMGLWGGSASGEGWKQLTAVDVNKGEIGHWWPQTLPGEKAVLFTNMREGGFDEHQIEIYLLETGKRTLLFKGGTYARYVSTGHIIYARKETLYAVRFAIERLRVIGSGVPVVADVRTSDPIWSGSAQFSVSSDGTLAYVPVQARSAELRPVWVDRKGRVEPLSGAPPGSYEEVAISPDGTQAAFTIKDGGERDVWIYDLTRNTLNPLTSDGKSWAPIWAANGKQIIFMSGQLGKSKILRQMANGSGEPGLLMEQVWWTPTSCSPDGNEILIVWADPDTNHPETSMDIWVVPLEGKEKGHQRVFIHRDGMQRQGSWSPDGCWVAYSSDETRWWEVYVEPYPGPGPKVRISIEGGYEPKWSRDGKELFYRSADGNRLTAAKIETEPKFMVTGYEKLFAGRFFGGDSQHYDVAPDGRFLMIQESEESAPACIHVVLNWFEELKRLVPVEEAR